MDRLTTESGPRPDVDRAAHNRRQLSHDEHAYGLRPHNRYRILIDVRSVPRPTMESCCETKKSREDLNAPPNISTTSISGFSIGPRDDRLHGDGLVPRSALGPNENDGPLEITRPAGMLHDDH